MTHYARPILTGTTIGISLGVALTYLWLYFNDSDTSFPM